MANGGAGAVSGDMLKLSIIVKVNTYTHSYKKQIKDTLKSLRGFFNDYSDAECVLTYSDASEKPELEKILKKTELPVKLLDQNDAGEESFGKYVMVAQQGDVFKSDSLLKEMSCVDETDRGIYSFRISAKDAEISEDEDAENQWRSIFKEPYVRIIDPHCVMIRTTLLEDPADLLSGGAKATEAVIRAILINEGFVRIASRDVVRSDHAKILDYKIDDGVMDRLIALSEDRFGLVEDYLQNVFLSIILLQSGPGSTDSIRKYLQYIDSSVITENKDLKIHQKIWLLNLKFGKEFLKEVEIADSGQITYEGKAVLELKNLGFRIDVTEINRGVLTFEGRTDLHLLGDRFEVEAYSSEDGRVPVELVDFPALDETGPEGEVTHPGKRFRIDLNVKEGASYKLYLKENTGRMLQIIPSFSKYSRIAYGQLVKGASINGYLLTYDFGTFYVCKSTGRKRRQLEKSYLRYLFKEKKYQIAIYRILYYLDKLIFRKPVWIVADRPHLANDNGEHMFRYLQTTEAAKKNTIYFLIRKDSADYERLKKTGKVLAYGSHKHKIKFLRSQVIMCAAANDLAINAMGKSGRYYRDLLDYHFIYLRHGVSHNDQSRWINKLNKHISLLVATCRPEYEGILEGSYDYTEKEAHLTGLPRYDNLYDEKEKEIIILPTWRKNLEGEAEYRSSERSYSVDFADSDYCKFYNGLINNERLLAVMEEYGYKGCFYLHPVFEKQFKDFKSSSLISVGKGAADYQVLFRKGAIMVTDYSSVAFDFAFLKKPVIYAQFDEDVFYKYHSWGKGYFTYRKDGFGPITNTLDETVDELIYYIKNDCKMKDEYVTKVENFFAYTDRNNCKRVYDAVVELEKEREAQ